MAKQYSIQSVRFSVCAKSFEWWMARDIAGETGKGDTQKKFLHVRTTAFKMSFMLLLCVNNNNVVRGGEGKNVCNQTI